MRPRVVLAAALVLVLSLLTGGTALATNDSDQHDDETLYFLTRTVEEELTFEGQPQPGDQVFFEEVVFESNADMEKGQRVGRSVGIVTFAVTGALVDVGVSFDDGDQLFTKGAFFLEDLPVRTFDLAVVGGTGQYEGATGGATGTNLSPTRSFIEVRIDD